MVSLPFFRILSVDFASPHGLVWIVAIFVIVLAPAYLFWSNGTSGTQGYLSSQVTAAVEPAESRSRDEQASTAETKVIFPGHGNDSVLEATSSQGKGRKPRREHPKPAANASKIALARTDYTVGWICALDTEYAAAQVFLDEEHEAPDYVPDDDDNDYTLGRVGRHNIVIAVLPHGEYGIGSAASVAKDLSRSFPNIRIGFMVGVGGGAPSERHDIRLGDVVVSAPGNGHGGVFQYDFGKMLQGEPFHTTGVLNQSPKVLRSAVAGLKTKYEKDGHFIDETISDILEDNPRLRQKYGRPLASTDRLYRAGIPHPPNDEASCATCCGNDPSHLVPRRERTMDEDNPAVHYGLIASANRVLKDASFRDKLSAEKGVLCFEMEAAGLMNQFPCLVIRGICDYSDSHKNKNWQGYAAMAAAAYTKDLLGRISQQCVRAEPRLSETISSE